MMGLKPSEADDLAASTLKAWKTECVDQVLQELTMAQGQPNVEARTAVAQKSWCLVSPAGKQIVNEKEKRGKR